MENRLWTTALGLALTATASACTPTQFQQMPMQANTITQTPMTQPTPLPELPNIRHDSFLQDANAGKVDILIIDDNSLSMGPEQAKMAQRFPSFVSALSDLDYHIAVTTTDIDSPNAFNLGGRAMNWNGTTSPILTHQTANASSVFLNTIQRQETAACVAGTGTCPSGNEQPLAATILAMQQKDSANAGVFRDGVDLAVVVISDEDEQSNAPSTATTAEAVVNAFNREFGATKRLRAFGLVVQSGDDACLQQQIAQFPDRDAGAYGTRVEALAALTGGQTESICADDYSKSLANISASVRKLVGTFELSAVPQGPVLVTLQPFALIPYHVEDQNLVFDTPPPAGTQINVTYLSK